MTAASLRGRVDAVVIGASAGGIEALGQILPGLPASLAVPICIVVHLPRERPSLLVDVFAPRCACRVREADDKEPPAPGTIYFAPPDYHLLIDQGPVLALSADEDVNFSRPSVDVLFESAAEVYGSRLAGIVLSGANHDGAAGARAIHAAGGVLIVQQPESAHSRAMVDAVLAATEVEWSLNLSDIARTLLTLAPEAA